MPGFFFTLASPAKFRRFSRPLLVITSILTLPLFAAGLYLALIASPPDAHQHEAVRIMYIHVPAAWLSLLCYFTLSLSSFSFLIWRHTLAGLYIRAAAPLGACFTALCLITGALWGRPTWGAWWVWDARLTSVLILFFIYLGIIALSDAFDEREKGLRAAAWLTLIGSVNLPIIKFSVLWWNTLHQPPSISSFARLANPAIDHRMLWPLFTMAAAYLSLFITLSIIRLDSELITRKLETRQ